MTQTLITPAGLARLREEFERLTTIGRQEIAERIGYNVAQVSRTSAALRGGRRGRGCESGARRRDDALDDAGPGTRTADV